MEKTIHFIRHGQTRYNFEKKLQGSIDIIVLYLEQNKH